MFVLKKNVLLSLFVVVTVTPVRHKMVSTTAISKRF